METQKLNLIKTERDSFGRFVKYHPGFWLGKKRDEKTKYEISKSHKGKHLSIEHKNNLSKIKKQLYREGKLIIPSYKGHHQTEEAKRKISLKRKGKPTWNKGLTKETDERINAISKFRKNKTYEEIYGIERTKKIKEKQKLRMSRKLIFNKHHSEISKLKMGKTKKERYKLGIIIPTRSMLGKHHSVESKLKIRLGNLRKKSEETKNKMKLARMKIILPKKDTKIEVKIQNFLKELRISFFTHQYMKEIEHGYQCDIFIPSMNLVIECDGDYWHKYPVGREIDHIRSSELIEKGFKILRLWENEIRTMSLEKLKNRLWQTII